MKLGYSPYRTIDIIDKLGYRVGYRWAIGGYRELDIIIYNSYFMLKTHKIFAHSKIGLELEY